MRSMNHILMQKKSRRCLKKWEFYIGKSLDDPQRATVIFQGPENVLYDIFMNPETKPIVEASGHIYEGTKITRWIS